MPKSLPRRAHSTPVQLPEDLEDDELPVDSDDGLIAPMIDEDPEYDRMVEPED